MKLYCCGCQRDVNARLTDGRETYPHRADLSELPFWICDTCKNFVGCHHKTAKRTKPLGCIPTKEIKNARQHIHRILDPLWQSGRLSRAAVYRKIAAKLGKEKYHTADIRSLEEARRVYHTVQEITAWTRADKEAAE